MKKILLSAISVVLCLCATAQEKVAEYHSGFYNKDFYVELGSMDEEGDYRYYVEVSHNDLAIDDVNISMYQYEAKEFIAALEEAKAKYIEWITVAQDNNVNYVNKRMDIKFPTIRAGFSYDGWDFSDNEVTPHFMIDNNKYLLVIKGSPITNGDYTCDGYNITFGSVEDIDSFIKCFDEKTADNHYGKNIKAQLLAPAEVETTKSEYSDFTTYHSNYFDRDFAVKLSAMKNGDYTYNIEAASGDRYVPTVTINIKKSELKAMIDAFTKAADYYKRWSEVAEKNNVTDIDKTIDAQFPKFTGSFTYDGDWYSDNNETTLTPRFKIMDGKYLLILTGSKIVTDYVDCDNFYIAFQSQADIDSFLKCFDAQVAEAYFKSPTNTDSLFN